MVQRDGFTLIELSIVLVIIGLIVGGILLGRNLIDAAALRGQISQIEKFYTSHNTFLAKYGGIPGDLLRNRAAQLGFFAIDLPAGGTTGYGDGNGAIGSNESLIYWRHLTDAQMIDGNYGTTTSGNPLDATNGGAVTNSPVTPQNVRQVLPPSRLRAATFWPTAAGNRFVFYFYGLTGLVNVGDVTFQNDEEDSITPLEAYEIDRKMDEGLPNTGKIQSISGETGNCIAGGGIYDIGAANGNVPHCRMFVFY